MKKILWLMILLSAVAFGEQKKKPDIPGEALRATATAHSVTLNWTASITPCVTTTNIHRTQTPLTAVIGTNFASVPTATVTYVDSTVAAGQTYYYSLSGFGGSCGGTTHESGLGSEITVVVPQDCILPSTLVNGVCTAPPAPPTGLTGVPQ